MTNTMTSSTKSPHTIAWFEVPVTDIARAVRFYGEVLQLKLDVVEWHGTKMAIFPTEKDNPLKFQVHGSLVQGPDYKPSTTGSLVYFNCGDDLNPALGRIEKAGGKKLTDKISIGEHGFIAMFLDTEGNKVALYSTPVNNK